MRLESAVIMAGGKGTRLSPLKPVMEVCGKPMIQWVAELAMRYASQVYIATVKGHPAEEKLRKIHRVLYTSGLGYENDVVEAVSSVKLPALVLPSDVPFLDGDTIEILIRECNSSICTLLSQGKFVGVSLWRALDLEDYQSIDYPRKIVNVNTWNDLTEINKLC
ncbi:MULTISPECIES: NTP transferase domain-containing protein [Metallosphaera]|uniref:NTP transferase domain-containing protein n=1 Tax=Metallosphaera TaxID=41980 RepID=UPI000B1C27C4|nr:MULTISPECIES: NTP transferase domain-containing protein [Metallosphaera]MCY0861547.1 NTP transferase domain-containing protein [Metallosphaera prunae]WPX06768.1 NTP transferase domain-containing protein [Metallosphaera sedula DSM 5348]